MSKNKIFAPILAIVVAFFTPMAVYATEFSPLTGDDRETPWVWAIAIIAAVVILVYFAISAIRRSSKEKRKKNRRR